MVPGAALPLFAPMSLGAGSNIPLQIGAATSPLPRSAPLLNQAVRRGRSSRPSLSATKRGGYRGVDINWACWPEMVIGWAFGMLTMALMALFGGGSK